MASNPALELASAVQSASLKRHPDPRLDMNPPTAASPQQRVTLSASSDEQQQDELDSAAECEVPLSALRPAPRRPDLPPLPDLRFEQSYLKSIAGARGWADVALITLRDQVFLPLVQGAVWTLLLAGWRHWNRASSLSGASLGARVRRWWWGVNGWALPDEK